MRCHDAAQPQASDHAHPPEHGAGPRPLIVALVGNPNIGKTSLFNALTGFRRHVANYPGVTVDVARGSIRDTTRPMELLDLPGTYSLAAMSPDEMVVSNVLCGRQTGETRPDVILAIVDASNLHRNMYLISQLAELDLPMVLAMNMIDVARGRGLEIDCDLLARRLGVPVVPINATQPDCAGPIVAAIERVLREDAQPRRAELPEALRTEVERLQREAGGLQFAEALRVLMDRGRYAEQQFLERGGALEQLRRARGRLEAAGVDGLRAEVRARYAWIGDLLKDVIRRPEHPVTTWSDRLDRVLTHRIGGFASLLVVLFIVFEALFRWADPLMRAIDWAFSRLAGEVGALLPEGVLRSLVADGVIAGVGGVLTFLPQILILFAILAILEDCGYMARAAYMNDRLMRSLGLSGRAFIPLLSAFACAVPAIMGTRAIANRRERMVTILIAPFMSCSARLPVYVLLTSAIIPDLKFFHGWTSLHALVLLGMYLVGMVVAVPAAWLLKKTAFAGPPSGFMIELPSYKRPRLRAIWQRMVFAGREFVLRAGTIILLVNLAVWALAYFPHSAQTRVAIEQQAAREGWDAARTDTELAGAYLRESYLGRLGRGIEPAVRPIGWDWRIGMAVIASFPAREVVVASLGTIYNLGEDTGEQVEPLHDALRRARWDGSNRPVFTVPVALSIMVFFALCAQCASTLVMIGRETHSWVWPLVSFTGMTSLAYVAAWAVSAAATAAGW